jgi:hypothetical protein
MVTCRRRNNLLKLCLRESEKDHLEDPPKFYDMSKEMVRIEGEKYLEHEREKKAALGGAYVPN